MSMTWDRQVPPWDPLLPPIYDDLVLMINDAVSIFVTVLRAKAPSLVNHDEATNFVIE